MSRLPPFVVLLRELAMRRVVLITRYPIEAAGTLLTTILFFVIIIFGGRAFAGPQFSDNLDLIIVGYFLWSLSIATFQSLSGSFMSEAIRGTLEQLYVSPFGFTTIAAGVMVVNLVESLVWGGSILALVLLISGKSVYLNLGTTVVLALLTIAPIAGAGFLLGGLAVLYKRLQSLFGLIQYGFLGLIALPVDRYPVLKVLPVADGSLYIRQAMLENKKLWEFAPSDLLLLVAKSVLFITIGIVIFERIIDKARERGVIGHF